MLYSGHVDSQNIADACEGGLPVQGFSTIHEDILAAIHAFYQRSSRQSGNSYAWIADMCPGLCHENDPRWEQNYESPRVDDNIRISYIAIGKLSGRFREFSSNDPLVTEVLCQFENEICDDGNPTTSLLTCPQNGICLQQTANTDYACLCNPDHTGAECEVRLENCNARLCENGGSCVEESNGYSCNCAAGYTGMNCETDVDDCDGVDCNSGTCLDRVDAFYCDCFGTNGVGENCADPTAAASPSAAATTAPVAPATTATVAPVAPANTATVAPVAPATTATMAPVAPATTATVAPPGTVTESANNTTTNFNNDTNNNNNNNTASAAASSGFGGIVSYAVAGGAALLAVLSGVGVVVVCCKKRQATSKNSSVTSTFSAVSTSSAGSAGSAY